MFRSATLRLTGWYLLLLMSLSIIFSVVIFKVASGEIETRLERFQTGLQLSAPPFIMTNDLRAIELSQAQTNLSVELLYVNLFILVAGGFASYLLARRHLAPIEKAHDLQSRFTSDASHELRTPLAVMKTEIEVALRNKTTTATSLKEVLLSNLEEVDKLSKLAEMLLNLSRIDHTKLQLGPVNLTKVARDIVKDFNQLDSRKTSPTPGSTSTNSGKTSSRIVLTSKKQPIINGNKVAIADLIKILIDNALQFSPSDSQITINISEHDQHAKFEITNVGPGIQPDKLPHIFDRFYRADSSRTNRTNGEHKGFGLGLALAKSIVELHNGELIACSVPGHETTFTAILSLFSKT